MNELTTDLKSLHEATLNNLKSSKANNTLRAYKSDFKDFGAFCAKHGLNPLPTEPKIVSLYLTHLSKNSKISTLRRRLVSISMVHRLKGHYLDTKHPIIVENLMGIRRVKGSIQKGKKPLLINHLKLIINVIDEQKGNEIKKLRDKSIILIGFGGGFRRTELISIDYEDLEFVPEGLKINIKNFWVVRQFKNEYNPVHYHDGNISGVGYLKIPKNLNFSKKKKKTNGTIDFINGSRMFLNKSIYNHVPKVGDLILFPNYLMHTAYPFVVDGERRSFSFNVELDKKVADVFHD